jgi:hypothetical protein
MCEMNKKRGDRQLTADKGVDGGLMRIRIFVATFFDTALHLPAAHVAMVVGLLQPLAKTGAAVLGSLRRPDPFRAIASVLSLISRFLEAVAAACKQFGPAPTLAPAAIAGAIFSSKYLPPEFSLPEFDPLLVGIGALGAFVVIRSLVAVLRGAVPVPGIMARLVGVADFRVSKLYSRSRANHAWTDTKNLSSTDVARLNDQFELATAEEFMARGLLAKVNGASLNKASSGPGDGGVDVIVSSKSGSLAVVSCKRYADPVGVKEVRDIFAVSRSAEFRGSRPVLITTVGFTAPAHDFARVNGVTLATIDRIQALDLSAIFQK